MNSVKEKELYNSDRQLSFCGWLEYLYWQHYAEKHLNAYKEYKKGNGTFIENLR